MNYQNMMTRNYLYRFDQILDEMASKMLNANFTNNITINFIECMIPHHQAAIYMCENLLKYTTYPPLINIAKGIIEMQTRGIEQMKEIRATTTARYNNITQDVNDYVQKYLEITKNMIDKMKNSPRCLSINLNFVNEMIPHHEGAVEMCENLLQYYIDPRLKQVANTIIEDQSRGIEELKQIRQKLCKK